MSKNLILASNPTRKRTRRTAAQKAASKRNIRKAQAARRRRTTTTPKRRRRAATTTRKRSYRRRSNPIKNPFKGILQAQVFPALIGGGGAVVNDLIVNLVPGIPDSFRVGWMRHLTKALGAVAISFVGGMFLPKKIADQLGAGAMTVVGYNVVRDLAAQFAPTLPMGEYLTMGEYLDPALGYYGAGLDPSTVPGSGMETAGQFTRGTPYLETGAELDAWPTGGAYDDLQY